MFYGPGGPYASFAGRDVSRALAKMSFESNDLTGDVSGLSPFEVEALHEWEYKFKSKYVTIGTIKKTVPMAEGDAYTARRTMTAERDISESTMESNHEPEPTENGARKQGSILEKTRETLDADVSTISHEYVEEKAKELTDLEVPNESNHTDAVEKPEETPNVAVRNNSGTEDAADPNGTPQVVDEKNTSKPEDATENAKEAPDAVDMNNRANHEDVGQPKETQKVDEKDLSCHQCGEKPKEASNVEEKNA